MLTKIIGYNVYTADTAIDLEARVRAAIHNGWEPQGGVNVAAAAHKQLVFSQAMIMRGAPSKDMPKADPLPEHQ